MIRFYINIRYSIMFILKTAPSSIENRAVNSRNLFLYLSKDYSSNKILMISTAALVTDVPGPNMAATPSLYKKS